jgi:hypothetical protein
MDTRLIVKYITFYTNTIQLVKTTLWLKRQTNVCQMLFSGWWYSSVMQRWLAMAFDSDTYV